MRRPRTSASTRRARTWGIALVVGLGVATVGCSESAPDISVTNAQILVPTNPEMAAVYFDIVNHGGDADVLVTAEADRGESSMHRSGVSPDGVAMMEHVTSVDIAANETTRFTTGDYHLMIDNPGPLAAGDTVSVTLSFEASEPITVDASVVASLREDDYDR